MELYELYDHEVTHDEARKCNDSKGRALRSSERKWESILAAALRGDKAEADVREQAGTNCALCSRYAYGRAIVYRACPLKPTDGICYGSCSPLYAPAYNAAHNTRKPEPILELLNEIRAVNNKPPLTINDNTVYVGGLTDGK